MRAGIQISDIYIMRRDPKLIELSLGDTHFDMLKIIFKLSNTILNKLLPFNGRLGFRVKNL
jgi:hypothetical protein